VVPPEFRRRRWSLAQLRRHPEILFAEALREPYYETNLTETLNLAGVLEGMRYRKISNWLPLLASVPGATVRFAGTR
jgi:hypothetical protein